MTDKQKQSIRDMRRAGQTYSAIADFTGLSPNTVKSFCLRNNICVVEASDDEHNDVCKYCGKRLEHITGKKKKRFCNSKCRNDWWNRNRWWRHKKVYLLVCYHCSTEFNSYGNKQRKYCSRDCYIRSRYGEGLP